MSINTDEELEQSKKEKLCPSCLSITDRVTKLGMALDCSQCMMQRFDELLRNDDF